MAPIRIGFIGLSTQGWASTEVVPPLFHPLLASKYTLTALCTRSEASATAAAKKYSELAGRTVKPYYGKDGVQGIVHDPEVDMVGVTVKMPDHFDLVMAVIDAGKDLFVEWTPGSSYEQTVRIAEAAKRKGIRVLVGGQANQGVAINKVKELIEGGKIGRVLSTTAILSANEETLYWGPKRKEWARYNLDINNGANLLTIPIGHFVVALDYVLGSVANVSASGAILYPSGDFVDSDRKPTGEIFHTNAHDQIAFAGTFAGAHEGAFYNIHARGGVASTGERGRGRRLLQWIIDGEDGTIELANQPGSGWFGAFAAMANKDVFLNGEKVELVEKEEDQLGHCGKAWLEFAKGPSGNFTTIDDAVRVHRVLDAVLTSIKDGKRVDL